MLREQERRRLIRNELDKQLQDKKKRAEEEKQEARMYETLQNEHIKLLGQREQEKLAEQRNKIEAEKASRDRQLREEKLRKRKDEKNEF